LQYSKILDCLLLKLNVKLEVSFRSVEINLYPKRRRNLGFRNVIEMLPDYTVSS